MSNTALAEMREPAETPGSWLDQLSRHPDLDEAIATFAGSINFLRRSGLEDAEILRLCQINLMYVDRRGR